MPKGIDGLYNRFYSEHLRNLQRDFKSGGVYTTEQTLLYNRT